MLNDKIKQLVETCIARISNIDEMSANDLQKIKSESLGKNSELQNMLKSMRDLSPEERPAFGQLVNEARKTLESAFAEAEAKMKEKVLNEKLKEICKEWAVTKDLSHSLIFGIDAVAEGLYVNGIRDEIRINMVYDQMQIKIQILTHNAENLEESNTVSDKKGVPDELELALIMLKNRFDHVRWIRKGQQLSLNIDADL